MREQDRVREFEDYITVPKEGQVKNLKEEVIELILEIDKQPDVTREVAEEATDVIISCLGFIQKAGLDFTELFDTKMQTMWNKYRLVPLHKGNGDSHDLAVQRSKSLWNESH